MFLCVDVLKGFEMVQRRGVVVKRRVRILRPELQKPPKQQQDLPVWLLACIFATVALTFDLYRLGNPSIWFDEAFSVELARQPLPLLWHIIFGPEPNMELYYLFLHFWLAFTGWLGWSPTEVVVRLPSAIFAAFSTGVVFLLGQRFLGALGASVATALYLLNDLQLTYAQQTRSYSLQLLLLCIAWLVLLYALTTPRSRKRWWFWYVVTMTLAAYAQLFSLLILCAQMATVIVLLLLLSATWRKRLPQMMNFSVSLCSIGVLIAPLLWVSRHGSKTGWLPIPHLHDMYHLFLTISGESKSYLLALCALCLLGLAVVALRQFARGRLVLLRFLLLMEKTTIATVRSSTIPLGGDEERARQRLYFAIAMVCWLVIPVVLSYVVSQGTTRLFSSRYLVVIVPPLCLLVGLGVATLRWRVVQVVLALLLCALAMHRVPLYYASAQVEDWNSTTHWLSQQYQTGDGIVCYDNVQGCQISVEYYLHAYPGAAHFEQNSPGAYSWTAYGPANPTTGYEAAVDTHALSAYMATHARLFYITGRIPDASADARAQVAIQWLNSHYHLVGIIVTRTVTVRLYVKEEVGKS